MWWFSMRMDKFVECQQLLIINALHLPVLFFNLAFEYGLGVSKFIKLHQLFTADKVHLLISSSWQGDLRGRWVVR
jgi:hypothetical protein